MINLLNAKSIFCDVSLMSQHFCHGAAKSLPSFSSWSPENSCVLFRKEALNPRGKENNWRRGQNPPRMACRGTQQITTLTPDLRFWSSIHAHLSTCAYTRLFPTPRPETQRHCLCRLRGGLGEPGMSPATGLRGCPPLKHRDTGAACGDRQGWVCAAVARR